LLHSPDDRGVLAADIERDRHAAVLVAQQSASHARSTYSRRRRCQRDRAAHARQGSEVGRGQLPEAAQLLGAVEAAVSYTHLDVYKRQHEGTGRARRRGSTIGHREQIARTRCSAGAALCAHVFATNERRVLVGLIRGKMSQQTGVSAIGNRAVDDESGPVSGLEQDDLAGTGRAGRLIAVDSRADLRLRHLVLTIAHCHAGPPLGERLMAASPTA